MKPQIHLVLGSGGARGIAHIGVIEELIKNDFEIKSVAGCSMGALVGGIYCAGKLDMYKKWLLNLDKYDVFKLVDFTFSTQGFVKGERVFKVIEDLIGDHYIEDFEIPFCAVATDISSKNEVLYKNGSLFHALRASVAIPTVVTPATWGKKTLVDGGVLNPLPLNQVKKKSEEEIVVAVNVNASIEPFKLNIENEKKEAAYQKRIDKFFSQVFSFERESKEANEHLGYFDLLNTSFDLLQDRLTEVLIQLHKPELVVNVSRDTCGTFEFYRAKELIKSGEHAFGIAYEKWKNSQ
ncbi:MAG TPA: patatin-like phospholipase family protein [Cyclobacteriaceae bacterium]|nr:patatin-like phospholipase family protein [Cyclobacteriaceae bacterium]